MDFKDKDNMASCKKNITVDIVIPVYNEEDIMEETVKRLTQFFNGQENLEWRIVIASNGSVDRTREIGEKLTCTHPGLSFFHISEKGRGRALKKAFRESRAEICAYTDADLSVDISVLPLLIENAVKYNTIAMPNRLSPHANVKRPFHRILLSRAYNLLIRSLFPRTFIEDAQVGMKAAPRAVLQGLLDRVKSDNFFFDTELSLLAERAGFKIIHVPADCYDMRTGRVRIIFCILEEFLGLMRMRCS